MNTKAELKVLKREQKEKIKTLKLKLKALKTKKKYEKRVMKKGSGILTPKQRAVYINEDISAEELAELTAPKYRRYKHTIVLNSIRALDDLILIAEKLPPKDVRRIFEPEKMAKLKTIIETRLTNVNIDIPDIKNVSITAVSPSGQKILFNFEVQPAQ
jgi:hypothetical protein